MCWKLSEQPGPEDSDQSLRGQLQKSHKVQSCLTPSLMTWTNLPWLGRVAAKPKGRVTLWQGREKPHGVQLGKMQSLEPREEQPHATTLQGQWPRKQRKVLGSWRTKSWMRASNVPLWKRRGLGYIGKSFSSTSRQNPSPHLSTGREPI